MMLSPPPPIFKVITDYSPTCFSLPTSDTAYHGLGPLISNVNRENVSYICLQTSIMKTFFSCDFLFSDDSSLFHVYKTKTKKNLQTNQCSVCVCVGYLQRPEEWVRSLGAEITGDFELPFVSAGDSFARATSTPTH